MATSYQSYESDIVKIKLDSAMQTPDQIRTKIAQLDILIESLYASAIKLAGQADRVEYEIDDGQTKMKFKFADPDAVGKSIERYEKLRQMLQNRLLKPGFRLMDSKNFYGRNYGNIRY